MITYQNDLDFALKLDAKDPLKKYKNGFYNPEHNSIPLIYFCGNSLGLQPKLAESYINEELKKWKDKGVKGHFEGIYSWYTYHKTLKKSLSEIVGANEDEVSPMNSLTTNLHLLLYSFCKSTSNRNTILMEENTFSSDWYAIQSFTKNSSNKYHIEEVKPSSGKQVYETAELLNKINDIGSSLSLVVLSGIHYLTGQYFDLEKITNAAHSVGAKVGFDLAHVIGNVPLKLHDWNVDFAVWCSYKYLNSGPGGVGGIFIHERYATDKTIPRLEGWFGYNEEERFLMKKEFVPEYGADAWQHSNGNILSLAVQRASLKIFEEVGMDKIREKSIKLTGYLEFLLEDIFKTYPFIHLLTPTNPNERGSQLSLIINKHGKEIHQKLDEAGVVVDWREPNVLRVAPAPLYNSYKEVYKFFEIFKVIMNNIIK